MSLRGLRTSPVSWLGGNLLLAKWIRKQQVCGLPATDNAAVAHKRKSALQSRGGNGFAPSSRTRSLRLVERGEARCGLRVPAARGRRVGVDANNFYFFAKSVTRGRPEEVISTVSGAWKTCSSKSL